MSNKSLMIVRNKEVCSLCVYLLYFWQVLSLYLTFDPSFNLQFLNSEKSPKCHYDKVSIHFEGFLYSVFEMHTGRVKKM